jgi:LysM repeat protein
MGRWPIQPPCRRLKEVAKVSVNCPGGSTYLVQPGDTLFRLAQRFGLTLPRLLQANPQIANPDVLRVGQSVCIPGTAPPACPGFLHPIRAGETLFTLARRFATTVQEILRFNPGLDPERLAIGQELCIPIGEPARRRCLLLNPTDITPESEAMAYLNPVAGRIFVMATSIPRPEELPGGEVYKMYLGRQESDDFAVAAMVEGLPGVWIVNATPFFPIPEIQSILVSAEQEENVGIPEGLGVAILILGPPS